MLALTPEPLQTAGERAVFAELARWDTGGAVRSAVVASLPMVDGPMGRRISDAVLFVPEGLAVVRIAEVPKQRGTVTAVPEGAWSISADARPGEVLQIAGGGSSPLDGLMRAGMEAAVRLRSAGLEPGRIARLTVLVGDLTGLVPADGDLGEGDQVALLESRSLLLGIARSARYAGVGNPRLWTTADVRTALEVLGVPGRGPSVEELNGEGFPYSPYVLRKRELLTPAAMHAASVAAPPPTAAPAPGPVAVQPPVAPVTGGFVAPTADGPRVDPAAAAAVAAAAIRADEAAAAHQAAVAARAAQQPVAAQPAAHQQVAYQQPWAAAPPTAAPAPADETDGIGGLFAGAERTDPGAEPAPPGQPGQPATLVGPAVAGSPAAGPDPGRRLLDQPQTEWPSAQRPSSGAPAPERPSGAPRVVARRRPDRTRRLALLGGGVALVVLLLVLGLVLALGGDDGDDQRADATPTPSSTAPSDGGTLAVGAQTTLDGLLFTLQRLQEDDGCADHAYGSVADFFARTDCAGLARALWSTQVDGRDVVVSVAVVDMGEEGAADALRALADTSGSGNVSDLLREGLGYPGGPERLQGAEYASAVEGTVVTIVETDWVGPAGSTSDLDLVAATALALEMPDPTP